VVRVLTGYLCPMSTGPLDPVENEPAEQDVDERYPDEQQNEEDAIATNTPDPDPERPETQPPGRPQG
jgi:hypothetical protein